MKPGIGSLLKCLTKTWEKVNMFSRKLAAFSYSLNERQRLKIILALTAAIFFLSIALLKFPGILTIFLFCLALLLLITLILWLRKRKRPDDKPKLDFEEEDLGVELASRLGGDAEQDAVVWKDGDAEVIVHLNETRVRIREGVVLVSVTLESDQTGRQSLVVPFIVGDEDDPAKLFTVTETIPRGDPVLAARWGEAAQEAVWGALLGLAEDQASQAELDDNGNVQVPVGLVAQPGKLQIEVGSALTSGDIIEETP